MYKYHFKTTEGTRTKTVERAYLYHWGKMLMDAMTNEKGEFICDKDLDITVKIEKITDTEQKERAEETITSLKKAQDLVDKTAEVLETPKTVTTEEKS